MLELSLDKVCFIVLKAREFHAKEEVVIPEEPLSPTDDWALQILADQRDDPSYQELKGTGSKYNTGAYSRFDYHYNCIRSDRCRRN